MRLIPLVPHKDIWYRDKCPSWWSFKGCFLPDSGCRHISNSLHWKPQIEITLPTPFPLHTQRMCLLLNAIPWELSLDVSYWRSWCITDIRNGLPSNSSWNIKSLSNSKVSLAISWCLSFVVSSTLLDSFPRASRSMVAPTPVLKEWSLPVLPHRTAHQKRDNY